MARGLIWLPLLILITGLTWVGWKEYQKVEGYRIWSKNFDKAKYDIYAVMGLTENRITWGKPTAKGILDLETFNLQDVSSIILKIGDFIIDANNLPTEKQKAKPQLVFDFKDDKEAVSIPFTELNLAAQWQQYLSNQFGLSRASR